MINYFVVACVIVLGGFVTVWIPYTELWLVRAGIKQDADERRVYWTLWGWGLIMFVVGVSLCLF